MDAKISTDKRIATLITAALDGALTDGQAKQLADINGQLGKLAWLAVAKRVAEMSGQISTSPNRLGSQC